MPFFWKNTAGIFLLPFSIVYGALISLRNLLYNLGIYKSAKASSLVISIGNITVGGTGKTPLVIAAAEMLKSKGRSVVIVSRGYGRHHKDLTVVSDGKGNIAGFKQSGDEPLLAARRLPDIPVIVCKSRTYAAEYAAFNFTPDIILLDDAFQHRKLYRNIDIVTIDASNPFGNGFLLPAGPCRENISRLKSANAVVITRADQAESTQALIQKLQNKVKCPIYTTRHHPAGWINAKTEEIMPVELLSGLKIFAFCGIGNPQAFFSTLNQCGVILSGSRAFSDHYAYNKRDIKCIETEAGKTGSSAIVTTEKDLMRLPRENSFCMELYALKIDLDIVENKDDFCNLINIF